MGISLGNRVNRAVVFPQETWLHMTCQCSVELWGWSHFDVYCLKGAWTSWSPEIPSNLNYPVCHVSLGVAIRARSLSHFVGFPLWITFQLRCHSHPFPSPCKDPFAAHAMAAPEPQTQTQRTRLGCSFCFIWVPWGGSDSLLGQFCIFNLPFLIHCSWAPLGTQKTPKPPLFWPWLLVCPVFSASVNLFQKLCSIFPF